MPIIILLICFVSIFLNLGILFGSRINLKEILIKSVLTISSLVVFITEILSFVNLLNFQYILLFWTGISFFNIVFLFFKRDKLFNFVKINKNKINYTFNGLNKFEKLLFFSVITILIFVFIQGLVYPPNNWDSMTYHLARIPEWISHQSVNHYPTHIFRQLYQPPFSEFVITHFNTLNYGDYFSNSLQFFFLVSSLFVIVSIVELFKLNLQYKLIAIVLAVTIPEVILQASSTQNDIVSSFFILTSIYYAIKSIKELDFQNYLFFGLSIGLGLLTKGTAYIYLAPIILLFTIEVFIMLFKMKKFAYLGYSIVTVIIIISINSGHYLRNYNLNNNILGINETISKKYSNEKMSIELLLSNILKNTGLQIAPFPINKISDTVIYKLHSFAGVNINNSETNFHNLNYRGSSKPNHDDDASNPIHFFFIVLSFILIGAYFLKNKKNLMLILYVTMILLQVIFFCLYLKWQPWHTRLHLPLFLESVPLICYALSINNIFKKLLNKTIIIFILYAFFIVLINYSRPFISLSHITSQISIFDNRYKKYFANRLDLYDEYNAVIQNISKFNFRNIGLLFSEDSWEYPLFSQFYGKGMNPIHIKVSNITKNIPINSDRIDCIISTTNNSVIDFNGNRYYNQNSKNKIIWLYK
jgi:4-amino-4-deoxy-L-arabinose transferase-like glycosyltransferase